MYRILLVVLVLTGGAEAGERCRETLSLAEFFIPEDQRLVIQGFRGFKEAVLANRRAEVARKIHFPFELYQNGRWRQIENEEAFLKEYGSLFTPSLVASLAVITNESLSVNWDSIRTPSRQFTFLYKNGTLALDSILLTKLPKAANEAGSRPWVTCPPIVIEGSVEAYNWVSHIFPGFENIYVDNLLVKVHRALRGHNIGAKIRVDFWGVSHLSRYNLPKELYTPGSWRLYLRDISDPPENQEVCQGDVQSVVRSVDESGEEVDSQPATVRVSDGKMAPVEFKGLRCYQLGGLYAISLATASPPPALLSVETASQPPG